MEWLFKKNYDDSYLILPSDQIIESNMELRHIQYFIAVAEELHFGRAAQRLSMSQPPLSQQIQQLERELNVQLFERNRREVRLTDAGKTLLIEAYKLLEASMSFTSTAVRINQGCFGKLNIGCIPTALYEVLPNLVNSFRSANPDISLAIQENDTAVIHSRLLEGQYDIGIMLQCNRPGNSKLDYYTLVKEKLVVALPNQHNLASQTSLDLSELSSEHFVMCERQRSPQFFDIIVASCLRSGYSPTVMYKSNSFLNQLGFVACGLAVAVLPKFISRVNFPGVKYKDLSNTKLNTELVLAWNPLLAKETAMRFIKSAIELYKPV